MGSSSENQRWEEAKQLQSYINQQSDDYHYILAGDLNLYSPNEQAYKLLVDSMSVDLVDPMVHGYEMIIPTRSNSTINTNGPDWRRRINWWS